jgi:hypothetical protein
MMNESRTESMLQRVPVILAVTASSYGLSLQAGGTGKSQSAASRHGRPQQAGADGKPMAQH